MKILDVAVSMPWAIQEPWLRTILEIAAGENPSIEAVESRLGRKLDNARTVTMRDGVAVIPVTGPIFRRANLFTEISGATSIEVLAQDFTAALEDPLVKSIILNVDSPGGTVNGVNEFAEMVFAARGRKPVVAYVGNLAASAAYWIASAADEMVGDETAGVGSIGVVAVVPDPSKRTTKELEIVSSQSPKKRLDPSTEAGKREIQKEVDSLADIFIEKVGRNRGVTTEKVMSEFGEGGIVMMREAVALGMADRLGSLESLITEMQTKHRASRMVTIRSHFGNQTAAPAAQEKDMNEGIFSRLASLFGVSRETETETAEPDAVMAAAEELKAENERLRTELAAHQETVAETAKVAEEERQQRIDAEVKATIVKYDGKLGRAAVGQFETLLREVKAGSVTESSLLAFVDALPSAGPTDRVQPAAIDTDAVAAEIATPLPPDAARDAKIRARADKDGVSYHEAWAIVVREEQEAAIAKA